MRNRKRYIRPNQVQALINYFYNQIEEDDKAENKALLVYTLWKTGRRISEIVGYNERCSKPTRCIGLTPADFDEEERTVSFSILKKMPVKRNNKTGVPKEEYSWKKELWTKEPFTEVFVYDDSYFDTMVDYIKRAGIRSDQRIFP